MAEVDRMIRCSECPQPWHDPRERWLTFLTVDNELAHYCLSCADDEFSERTG